MAFTRNAIAKIYSKRAATYDLSANLYYLVGIREFAYREKAVEALALQPGDTVVEIGCGTGLNFPLIQKKIGTGGRIVGVELTPAMAEKARRRGYRNGWLNVEVVNEDAASFVFPDGVGAVLSTFALTLVPEHDTVIRRAAAALPAGGRMAVLDFKRSDHWPDWLVRWFVRILQPFAVTLDLADRHPWESMERHMKIVRFEEMYFGGVYVCAAETDPKRRLFPR
jgi:demethylmenaquinone methyltransferase/2-methoxy-6-polyprenyl-1,4-benzoquinol methylase